MPSNCQYSLAVSCSLSGNCQRESLPSCSAIHSFAIASILLMHRRRHPNIVLLHFDHLLPLCSGDHKHNPKNPDRARSNAVCDYKPRALSSQEETKKTVNNPYGHDDAPEPDVCVRIGGRGLVAFILKMMNVAEDRLESKNHNDNYT